MTTNTPTLATQDPISEAILLLTEEADSLSDCHTRKPGDWAGEPEAKAHYDHVLAVIASLSKLRAPVADERVVRDWPEDFAHENGNYQCLCHRCKQVFNGHKRRVTCKVCRAALASAPVAGEAQPVELQGVAETIKEGDGFWRSCTGCHELNEGQDTGPYSAVLGCHLGNGCSECGGIGAIWDTADYQAMADDMARDTGQSVEPQASEAVRKEDVATVLNFIFEHFGKPFNACDLPGYVVAAVRRLEHAALSAQPGAQKNGGSDGNQ